MNVSLRADEFMSFQIQSLNSIEILKIKANATLPNDFM